MCCTRIHLNLMSSKYCKYLKYQRVPFYSLEVWHSGSIVSHINGVAVRRTRLVLGWLTISRFNSWCGKFILPCNHSPRSTQSSHTFVGLHNKYLSTSGEALQVRSEGRYRSCFVRSLLYLSTLPDVDNKVLENPPFTSSD